MVLCLSLAMTLATHSSIHCRLSLLLTSKVQSTPNLSFHGVQVVSILLHQSCAWFELPSMYVNLMQNMSKSGSVMNLKEGILIVEQYMPLSMGE